MVGVHDNSLVVRLDCRRDYSYSRVVQRVRGVDAVEQVGAAGRLAYELRQTRALDDGVVWQLIEIAGQHNERRRKRACDLCDTRLDVIEQRVGSVLWARRVIEGKLTKQSKASD